ncbi:MAG TPA: hypothetical protein VHI32_13630 [Burkholderiales bacterium]|jgi:hypothetical protein|nr:hypothetical protein [Burkholderiales bacterium]
MIEIALAFALGIIVVVLSLHRYLFPMLVLRLDPYWFPILVHRYGFPILLIVNVFIGIAFLVCLAFVCIPEMKAALEAYQGKDPDALHAYAMIVGSFGLIGAAYYLWDRYRKKSGSQDAARLPLDSVKE